MPSPRTILNTRRKKKIFSENLCKFLLSKTHVLHEQIMTFSLFQTASDKVNKVEKFICQHRHFFFTKSPHGPPTNRPLLPYELITLFAKFPLYPFSNYINDLFFDNTVHSNFLKYLLMYFTHYFHTPKVEGKLFFEFLFNTQKWNEMQCLDNDGQWKLLSQVVDWMVCNDCIMYVLT